jgi:uncharacterized protein (TIGR01777 family)
MRILLSGATGFIGRSLLIELQSKNYEIYALVRKKSHTLSPSIHQVTIDSLKNINEAFDIFINLAGENIAGKPWTTKRKKDLFDSRVSLTNKIKEQLKHPPKRIISMSAVGFYGNTREGLFDENTLPKQGFAHDLCNAWEDAAESFSSEQTGVVIFRLGVVLGVGGALDKMRLPFLCCIGGPIAGGEQWFSWIHIDDVVQVISDAIQDTSYVGTYNLVAPQFTDQKSFALSYGASLKRPAFLATPKWLLRLLLGEMASLLTEGPKISPSRLQNKGFEFKFKQLEEALIDIEGKYKSR